MTDSSLLDQFTSERGGWVSCAPGFFSFDHVLRRDEPVAADGRRARIDRDLDRWLIRKLTEAGQEPRFEKHPRVLAGRNANTERNRDPFA